MQYYGDMDYYDLNWTDKAENIDTELLEEEDGYMAD